MPGLTSPWDLPDPLAALREGDPGPFEAFVHAAAGRFAGFFRRQGADAFEAEDLAQEVFLKLHQNAARYRPEERFAPYCFRVARNVWIDARRRRSARIRPTSLDGGADAEAWGMREGLAHDAPGPAAAASTREEAQRMRLALEALPEHHRMVFELGVVQELSYAEIAGILEIPIGTVKSRMFHAVRKLRESAGADPEAAREGSDA